MVIADDRRPISEDRKLVHDLRNSAMVIRNLTELIAQGKMKDADREQALRIIKTESDKLVEMLKNV